MLTFVAAGLLSVAQQQPHVVFSRQVADPGFDFATCPPDETEPRYPIFETDMALSGSTAMIVSMAVIPPAAGGCIGGRQRIRSARSSDGGATWTYEMIHPDDPVDYDPCIEPGSSPGEFLVVAKHTGAIFLSKYTPAGGFSSWTQLASGGGMPLDKPWLVRGAPDEYYLFYFQGLPGPARYLRSTDGGASWVGGPVGWTTGFTIHPTVAGSGPVYAAMRGGGAPLTFVTGTDLPDGSVAFVQLRTPAGPPVSAQVRETTHLEVACGSEIKVAPVPNLVADPSDPDRLFLLVDDIPDPQVPGDVDVYVQVLQRVVVGGGPRNERWTIGPRVEVNAPDDPGSPSAQFLPTAAVDQHGRLHVAYYDNRSACGMPQGEQFRLMYAQSTDGQTFTRWPVSDPCGEADLDYGLLAPCLGPGTTGPKEYNGIALDETSPDETRIHLSYSGTSSQDTGEDKSVLYRALIVVED